MLHILYLYCIYVCGYIGGMAISLCICICMYMSDYLEMTISYLEQHRISAGEGLDEGEEVEVSFLF